MQTLTIRMPTSISVMDFMRMSFFFSMLSSRPVRTRDTNTLIGPSTTRTPIPANMEIPSSRDNTPRPTTNQYHQQTNDRRRTKSAITDQQQRQTPRQLQLLNLLSM